jgi:hypothetical protein
VELLGRDALELLVEITVELLESALDELECCDHESPLRVGLPILPFNDGHLATSWA